MKAIKEIKKEYFDALDRNALNMSNRLIDGNGTTRLLLQGLAELYQGSRMEREGFKDQGFESAYHQSVTSDFEFLIARILYHYSRERRLGWKIFLRRQKKKCVPDIRIESHGKTVAIIEIKASVGWM